jgi:protoporphyrinogen/coproporphyrinogen III oxidase
MPVAIVGGGISGLSTAYYLAKAGIPSTIVDSRPRLGGVIETLHIEGCTIEAGPDSFISQKPAALDLIGDLGLADDVIGSNDRIRKTFVLRNGRLVKLPDGLMMMVPTKILPLITTSLLSWPTKFRMGMELFRAPQPLAGDQSVADFVSEHYGGEAVDYLAEPLLSGIYGGNPRELSVTAVLPRFVELAAQYGSLTRGVLAERAKAAQHGSRNGAAAPLFRTLKGGLGQMVEAIARAIRGQVEVRIARAQSIERTPQGFRIATGDGSLDCDRLVLACEAHSAASLLQGMDERLARLLGMVPYSSSMTVALGFDAKDFRRPPEGFGFLIPKKERQRLVACTWVGAKFSHRAPEGTIVARCFLGGREDAAVLDESDETILSITQEELRRIAGVTATPRFGRIFRWPRSMAQYSVGHPQRQQEIDARTAAIAGLHLAGNAYQGIGVPDCIRMGKAVAAKLASERAGGSGR